MSSVLVSFLGKRFSSLFGQALSYIVGHCLIMTAWNVEMLLVGRFVCGLCQGKNKSFIELLDLKNPPGCPLGILSWIRHGVLVQPIGFVYFKLDSS